MDAIFVDQRPEPEPEVKGQERQKDAREKSRSTQV